MHFLARIVLTLAGFVLVVGTTRASIVRFEAEATGSPRGINDVVGYDSINGVVAREEIEGASGGELLWTQGIDRNFKILFAGTGINLIGWVNVDGADFVWTLDEGVMTGEGTQYGQNLDLHASIPIVSGLPNTLHTLEIGHKGTSNGLPVSSALRVDAFDVVDSGARTRYEDNGLDIQYQGAWGIGGTGDDALEEASGGTVSWTQEQNATATLDFAGSAVAITGVARPDASLLHYDIDSGLRSGTVDLAAANALHFGFWHRWPMLLANDLPAGDHTLVLTADIPLNAGAISLDAIDVFDAAGVPLLGDVNLDGEVNGLDVDPFVYVLLNGLYQAEADMNKDLAIDGLDVTPFVDVVVGGRAQQSVVPEPASATLLVLALLGLLAFRCDRHRMLVR